MLWKTNDKSNFSSICKYDCIKKLKISDKTLAKTLDKEIPYNGHYFRRLSEKIFC